jgi:hypothetical protein
MFYFRWLALCILSCSLAPLVVSRSPPVRCGKRLPAALQEIQKEVVKDCAIASLALFTHLPCPPSKVHRMARFHNGGTPHAAGFRLPIHEQIGDCFISMEVHPRSKEPISSIARLSENMAYLYNTCISNELHDGGAVMDDGIIIRIRTIVRQPPNSKFV